MYGCQILGAVRELCACREYGLRHGVRVQPRGM
uniref:Uncharacterized protein n=1 Tax=Siphoviridae sp. cttU829 TaxID=2823605 RepID=A0A8S5LCF2_9CAUD|nr:MAG TPA: hypothetical protein [Siphoviridae sp. cttU829]